MSFGPSGSWLLLDGAWLPPALAEQAPPVHRAGGFLQAAFLVAAEKPEAIFLDPEVAWHSVFSRTLPREGRPLLVAVGASPPPDGVADVWLGPTTGLDELNEKLSRAAARQRVPAGRLDEALDAA